MFTLKKFRFLPASLLLALLASNPAGAMGISKITLDVDANGKFSSVAKVVVFNDGDEAVYVTARPQSWDTDASGAMLTSPTAELSISPPMIRIAAGNTASFAVRYAGPKKTGESTYRAVFKETRLPETAPATVESNPEAQVMAGIVMSIPVFVSDFSEKPELFKDVTASFKRSGSETLISVKNASTRRVIVESVKNGSDELVRPHDTVFAGRSSTYTLAKTPDSAKGLKLHLSSGENSQVIDVLEEK